MSSRARHHLRTSAVALAGCLASPALVCGATTTGREGPTCIGAATRDPTSACVDRLTTVVPSVTGSRYEDPAPCRPIRAARAASACVLGASASRATLQFAFIGDSHTGAWSAALGELGQAHGLRGTVFTGPGCVMSEAVYEMGAIARVPCVGAYRDTQRWLRRHPEIDVVIATAEVDKGLPGPTATIERRKLRGFRQTFKRMPANVRRVIVLRDTPNPRARSSLAWTGSCGPRSRRRERSARRREARRWRCPTPPSRRSSACAPRATERWT